MTTVMEAVATAAAARPRLYPLGEVPASPAYPYDCYSASLGRGDVYGLIGIEGIRLGRVVTQHFAQTAKNALDAAEATRALLAGVRLAVTGYDCTPLEQELDPQVYRDPDNHGVIGVTQTFTFTATLA